VRSRRPGHRFNRGRIATVAGSSAPAGIDVTQQFLVDSAPTTLGVINITQAVAVEGTGTTASLTPPPLRVQVAKAVITLGGTMRAAGTSPPVVTLTAGTGSLTYTNGTGLGCPGLNVRCASVAGGTARGQALFDWSDDSGVTWDTNGGAHYTTAATFSIPTGAAAGNVINFATGTFNTDQTWDGTVATIRSTEGNSYTFSQATAGLQRVLRKAGSAHAISGLPIPHDALYDNANNHGYRSTDAAIVAMGTDDPALTVIARVDYNVADATGYWCAWGDSAQGTNNARRFGQRNTGTNGLCSQVYNNSSAGTANSTSTLDPSFPAVAHNECWINAGLAGGGGLTLKVDDVARTLGISSFTIGTLTPNGFAIGLEADSAPANGLVGYFYDLAVMNTAISAGEATAWNTALTNGTS
jgi:hypothetical protein